jgi:hypothetical protein
MPSPQPLPQPPPQRREGNHRAAAAGRGLNTINLNAISMRYPQDCLRCLHDAHARWRGNNWVSTATATLSATR